MPRRKNALLPNRSVVDNIWVDINKVFSEHKPIIWKNCLLGHTRKYDALCYIAIPEMFINSYSRHLHSLTIRQLQGNWVNWTPLHGIYKSTCLLSFRTYTLVCLHQILISWVKFLSFCLETAIYKFPQKLEEGI